ncbi:hypothetical protein AB0G05_44715 [Nonomuraea wenchangensis]
MKLAAVFMDELSKLVALGMPVMFTCGVAALAASLSRRVRQDPSAPPWPLLIGTVLAALGCLVMAVIAWMTHEDGYYDDLVSAVRLLVAVGGALVLLAGVASYVPWLPLPRRTGARLPAAVRLAARDVDRHLRRAGELIAITMRLTAFAGAGSRSARVLLRSGRGPALRLLAAGRAGWCMLAGSLPGTAAGCVIGLLLSWPMTTSVGWDELPRMPFETPWWLIAALAIGLPAIAALIAALPRPPHQTPSRQGRPHQNSAP